MIEQLSDSNSSHNNNDEDNTKGNSTDTYENSINAETNDERENYY